MRAYIRRFQPQLTIINSTVLPHTTRNLAKATGAAIAYSPVRGKHARMAQELLHYTKFISAATTCCGNGERHISPPPG